MPLAAGFATVCVSLLPFFQTRRFRAFRASLFAALGLWGIAPGLHAFLLYMDVPHVQRAFQLDLLMGAIYLVCPQRSRPWSDASWKSLHGSQ